MAYNPAIADVLVSVMDEMGIKRTFDQTSKEGLFTIHMKIHSRLQNVMIHVLVREDNFSVLATLPLAADENIRLAVAEYLTRANYNMRNGNFEMNMADGVIRFKTYHHVGEGPLDRKAARLSLILPALMIDRYGNGLIDVLFSLKSPREAIEGIGV